MQGVFLMCCIYNLTVLAYFLAWHTPHLHFALPPLLLYRILKPLQQKHIYSV